MRCTLVIGNGFDLDAGLKTSYNDFVSSRFWPFSQSIGVYGQDTLASYLRKKSELDTWFDVEEALYDYSRSGLGQATIHGFNIDVRDRFDFDKLKSSLTSYLSNQEGCFNPRSNSMGIAVLNSLVTSKNDYKIYSFNYTSLQNILRRYKITEQVNCEFIHGSVANNDIIIGVGDKIDYNSHYFYLSKIAAPNYSSHNIILDMMESDEVIIFGHSFGSNDFPYFEPFFHNQLSFNKDSKKRKRIAIFTKDENGRLGIKKRIHELTGQRTTLLYSLNEIKIFSTDGSMEAEIEEYLRSINKDWGRS